MKIYPLETGNFKLDGGAMFGVVPKSIWSRTNQPDENNMCTWSMRCMLIENGDRLTLIDTGIGNKQSEKFFSYYFLHGDASLDGSLNSLGFNRDDITDVFLTHLHFDHCGGAIERRSNGEGFEPAFKNAVYWSNNRHWKWATEPNDREKASFLSENILPIQESGQLKMVELGVKDGMYKTDLDFDVMVVSGHTDAQMCPVINYQGKKLVFMADLLPSVGHIPLAYVMGYDTRPLITLDEKKRFMQSAVDEEMYLFLEHDHLNEVCTVKNTERGVRLDQTLGFNEVFS